MKQVRLKIHGRVQGVFFRHSVKERAEELALVGWVRNADDNTVEVLAEGDEAALKKLLEWCRVGPPLAEVERVEEEWKEIRIVSCENFTID